MPSRNKDNDIMIQYSIKEELPSSALPAKAGTNQDGVPLVLLESSDKEEYTRIPGPRKGVDEGHRPRDKPQQGGGGGAGSRPLPGLLFPWTILSTGPTIHKLERGTRRCQQVSVLCLSRKARWLSNTTSSWTSIATLSGLTIPLSARARSSFTSTIEFLDRTRTGVKLGPITSWWIMLQDRTHYFSASTASCSYLLSEPVVEYLPIMANSTSSCRQSALRTSN